MKRLSKPAALTAAVIVLTALVPTFEPRPASAAGLCGMRQAVVDSLAADYGEVPVSWGLITGGHLIEVLVSPQGGFTVLITRPDGLACVLAAGDHWQDLAAPAASDPA